MVGRQLFVFVVGLIAPVAALSAQDSNRLTYLDAACDPYYVHRDFPKLTTPQWVGEEGVDAVVVLAIDDMRDTQRYEDYLRPILDRLKEIDGRAPVSIMTNSIEPDDPQLRTWIEEGLSIEVHTIDHPCPCLQGGDLAKAKSTYDRCVDLMGRIEGNHPLAYRMPCCDSLNTPSPRFWTEILHRTTPEGNFLTLDSSVFQVFTQSDPDLPGDLLADENGNSRFRHYIPFDSFVNTIEDYPYPYVIGRLSWEFPCMVPSDWEAQHVQQPFNPKTVEDLKIALDLTVRKQGVFNLVFHPHGWIRDDQVIELIDHAQQEYGDRVKFLTFNEAQERINNFMLAGTSLRDAEGHDNGVRLLDINRDGFLDVLIGQSDRKETRIWNPESDRWEVNQGNEFPFVISLGDHFDQPSHSRVRFGTTASGETIAFGFNDRNEPILASYTKNQWHISGPLQSGLSNMSWHSGNDQQPLDGLILRDIDGIAGCEILIARDGVSEAWTYSEAKSEWTALTFTLPDGVRLDWSDYGDRGVRFVDVDQDGMDDIVLSNEAEFAFYRFVSPTEGWSDIVRSGVRGDANAIPMIARDGKNNGAWFHSQHLWIQNEGTNQLPNLVERMSFADMLQTDDSNDELESTNPGSPKPQSANASMETIKTRPEFEIELVVAEPLVADPVAFDWGPDGSLWVVEMGDYPSGVDADGNVGGRLRVLRDTNGDGQYDRSTVFLDKLPFPTGVKVWRDGVIVSAAPTIFFARDVDGDDQADETSTLFEGFAEGNQQHRVNGLRWDMEGWLYVANGDSGGSVNAHGSLESTNIRGFDLRIDPDRELFEIVSGQTQFGRNRDDWGNWFGGNNSNPMWQYVLEDRYLRRNPHVSTPGSRRDVPTQAGNAPVFPLSVTLERFNDVHTANRLTSACSPIIFRDVSLGEEFYGNSFVCEPVHNLIHREVVSLDGYTYSSVRASDEQQSEFLASTDSWFRPVMVRTGPDGSLWIADMYRLVIEHPEWIPLEWQQRLDLRSGHELGRIYRVHRRDSEVGRAMPDLSNDTDEQLVQRLESTNGWVRDMAQQMLYWRGYKTIAPIVRVLEDSARPQSRVQALYCLYTLGLLENDHLLTAFRDDHPQVQAAGIKLCELRLERGQMEITEELVESIVNTNLDDAVVRFQLASSAGSMVDPRLSAWLANALIDSQDDPMMSAALLSSLNSEHLLVVFDQLINSPSAISSSLWNSVTRTVAGNGRYEWLDSQLSKLLENADDSPELLDLERATGLIASIQAAHYLDESVLSEVVPEWRANVSLWKRQAWHCLESNETPPAERIASLNLLGVAELNGENELRVVGSFISVFQPIAVQRAAIDAIAKSDDPLVAKTLLSNWSSITPSIRMSVTNVLLSRDEWTVTLLEAIRDGQVSVAQIPTAAWQRIRAHRSMKIASIADSLSGVEISPDRAELIDTYREAINEDANAAEGRALFEKVCANCHQLAGVGKAIGPDLSALTDRSVNAMLTAVLDPNRAIEDKYLSYVVITNDGKQTVGLLVDESSTSIRIADGEGNFVDVLRTDIDEIVSSGVSLMPEGFEKELDLVAMNDLIAFVRANSTPSKPFPGNNPRLIEANDEGVIALNANSARIYGPSIVMEPQYGNLGWWSSEDDWVAWDFVVPEDDTYEVVVEFACHAGASGDRFQLTIGDQEITGAVPSTGTWDDYEVKKIGRMKLNAGRHEMIIRSAGPIRTAMIDLLEIRLYPFLLDE